MIIGFCKAVAAPRIEVSDTYFLSSHPIFEVLMSLVYILEFKFSFILMLSKSHAQWLGGCLLFID